MDRADNAVYYAKRNGRNRVCEYEALVAQGALSLPQPESGGEAMLFWAHDASRRAIDSG